MEIRARDPIKPIKIIAIKSNSPRSKNCSLFLFKKKSARVKMLLLFLCNLKNPFVGDTIYF